MKRYITVKLNRLYLNYLADARDYIVEQARRQKKGLRFYIKSTGRWSTIPFDKLDEGEMGNRVFKSKIKNAKVKEYRLVSYSVTPDAVKLTPKEDVQLLIEPSRKGASVLLSAWKNRMQRH